MWQVGPFRNCLDESFGIAWPSQLRVAFRTPALPFLFCGLHWNRWDAVDLNAFDLFVSDMWIVFCARGKPLILRILWTFWDFRRQRLFLEFARLSQISQTSETFFRTFKTLYEPEPGTQLQLLANKSHKKSQEVSGVWNLIDSDKVRTISRLLDYPLVLWRSDLTYSSMLLMIMNHDSWYS